MAAELGELVMTIEADNLRLKKQLKSSEALTKKSADIMAKSLDKVSSSGEGTSTSLNILEKAAAATGFTWLVQVKNLAELALGLGKAKTLVTASTAAYRTESVAIGQNTAALAANVAARTAIPAVGVGGAAGGIGLAAAGGAGAGAGWLTRLAMVATSATGALVGLAAATVAVNLNIGGLRDTLGELGGKVVNWATGLSSKIEKADAVIDARLKEATARITARERVAAVRRVVEAKRAGLTGGAYVAAVADPRLDPRIVKVQVELANLEEKIRKASESKARAAAEAAQQVAKEKADQIRITAERERQAAVTKQQNLAAKAYRILGGMGSPAEMLAHAERLINQTARATTYQAKLLEVLRSIGGAGAEKVIAALSGVPPSAAEAVAGGRGVLVSARGMAGMPAPRLGAGGGGQSREKKKVRAAEKTAKNTGDIVDMMRQGAGMAN